MLLSCHAAEYSKYRASSVCSALTSKLSSAKTFTAHLKIANIQTINCDATSRVPWQLLLLYSILNMLCKHCMPHTGTCSARLA